MVMILKQGNRVQYKLPKYAEQHWISCEKKLRNQSKKEILQSILNVDTKCIPYGSTKLNRS